MLAQSVYAHTSSCGGSGVLVVHCLRGGGLATVLLTACWNSTFKDPLMDLVLGGRFKSKFGRSVLQIV